MGSKYDKWKQRRGGGLSNGIWTITVTDYHSPNVDGRLLKGSREMGWTYYPEGEDPLIIWKGMKGVEGRPKAIPVYVWNKIKEHAKQVKESIETIGRPGAKRRKTKDPLVSFLYELMRDHVVPGKVEKVVRNSTPFKETKFTNGYLAEYAEDIAKRLRKK